jgi:hypothetical protein
MKAIIVEDGFDELEDNYVSLERFGLPMRYRTTTPDGNQVIIEPTDNWNDETEVKCAVAFIGQTDYIWFTKIGNELVCQLNDGIRVNLDSGYQ